MPERVVEVLCRGGYGSGYLVGANRVVTALHVVASGTREPDKVFEQPPRRFTPREQIRVRMSGQAVWLPCQLLWPRPDQDDQHDVALLDVGQPGSDPVVPARWGRLTTSIPDVACEFTGFPRAQEYATATRDSVVRATEHMSGRMNLQTGLSTG